VLGIVHHRAIDALRRATVHDKRRASDEGIEERFEARERTDVEAARREEAGTVRGALSSLPADQSQVIELAYFGGFTHTEIADMLDAPVGTVKGRMRLGLKKMRAQLGEGQVTV
jgi:RNA polymerase sigma-70 factor, ECF subfamily